VIREKAEDLVEEYINNKKVSAKGRWDVKGKKGFENYDKYLKMTGRESEKASMEKGPAGRYK
jgi:hypothetical protein